MRLARKLTIVLALGVAVVLAVFGLLGVQREVVLYENDMRRDQHLMGRALSAAVAEVWRLDGQKRALELIQDANVREGEVRIRWVWLDSPAAAHVRESLASGEEVVVVDRNPKPDGEIPTFVPVPKIGGPRPGALALTESLRQEGRYVHASMVHTAITTVATAAVCTLIAMGIGLLFVGRPMRSLVEKARRVGAGDLTGPLALRQRDEIGELAGEMNSMCDRLAATQARLSTESQARIATLEQLRHADRLTTVGTLASGIAHELGTPLNVVAGRARMISSGEVQGAEATDSARIIGEQAARMTKIIRQLLDFARRSGPQKAKTDLKAIAAQTVALVEALAEKRAVRIHVTGDAPLVADVDAGQIQQALTNLVMNGIQAMTEGGELAVELARMRAQPPPDLGGGEGSYATIAVVDRGAGMSEGVAARIFEPFFTTKEVGEGTGLGLSVTYGIVREHGGWIGVESEIGKGSRFTMYLPSPGAPAPGA